MFGGDKLIKIVVSMGDVIRFILIVFSGVGV